MSDFCFTWGCAILDGNNGPRASEGASLPSGRWGISRSHYVEVHRIWLAYQSDPQLAVIVFQGGSPAPTDRGRLSLGFELALYWVLYRRRRRRGHDGYGRVDRQGAGVSPYPAAHLQMDGDNFATCLIIHEGKCWEGT